MYVIALIRWGGGVIFFRKKNVLKTFKKLFFVSVLVGSNFLHKIKSLIECAQDDQRFQHVCPIQSRVFSGIERRSHLPGCVNRSRHTIRHMILHTTHRTTHHTTSAMAHATQHDMIHDEIHKTHDTPHTLHHTPHIVHHTHDTSYITHDTTHTSRTRVKKKRKKTKKTN